MRGPEGPREASPALVGPKVWFVPISNGLTSEPVTLSRRRGSLP